MKDYPPPSGVSVPSHPPLETPAPDTEGAALDERYGRSPRRTLGRRWFAAIVAAAFVAVFAGWVIWAGLLGNDAQLSESDTGHVIVNRALVTANFDLTVDPGKKVGCAAEALDASYTVVGWKVIHVPAATARTRSFTVDVRTSQQAVTGLIYQCWLE